jgi:hypothetical protein
MAFNTEMKNLVIGLALVLALFGLSCSAETKGSGGVFGSTITNSPGQNGTGQTGLPATTPGNPGVITGPATTGGVVNTGFQVDKDNCAGANAQAQRIKPKVMFVVDRSGSTADPYPGSASKWQAMYDALMTPDTGVISKLQSVAYFGMVLFDGGDMAGVAIASGIVGGIFCMLDPASCADAGTVADAGAPACPRLIVVDPALNNYEKINAAYQPSGPGGTTPTALALQAAYSLLPDQQVLDQVVGEQFVVLATDGLPNGCMESFSVPDEQGPIDQVSAAAQRNIKTYVIGVAATVDVAAKDGGATAAPGGSAQAYLDKLASFGGTNKMAFSPSTKDDLVAAITEIIGGAVGCSVQLNGKVVPGQECSGTVNLNSVPLACNGADGFKLVTESEIELQGSACEKFKKDPMAIVNAKFPCESFVLE